MGRITSEVFPDDWAVCLFLNEAAERGWQLNNFFIKIVQGPVAGPGPTNQMIVFFDEDILDEPKRERPFYIP
jgi:hypothetical protein